jgi:hypothetical protein
MAEKRTTTPALITQVIRVGLTVGTESAKLLRRAFLDVEGWRELRTLGELAPRLALDDRVGCSERVTWCSER